MFAAVALLLLCAQAHAVGNTPPQFEFCPSDTQLETLPGLAFTTYVFDIVVTDAEDGLIANTSQTFELPVGEHFKEFTLFDEDGASAKCSFTLTVVDVEDPVIVCPSAPVVVKTHGEDPYTATFSCERVTGSPSSDDELGCVVYAMDNHAVDGIVAPEETEFGQGTHELVYRALDLAGNEASCTVTLFVELDNELLAEYNKEELANNVTATIGLGLTSLSTAAANSLTNLLNDYAATLTADDDQGIKLVASSLATLTANANGLNAASRDNVLATTDKLIALRRTQFATPHNSQCGDNVCDWFAEGCDCSADCGPCKVSAAEDSAAKVEAVRHWKLRTVGFGAVGVSVEANTVGHGALELELYRSGSSSVADPTKSTPKGKAFAGTSFTVTVGGGGFGALQTLPAGVAVAANLSQMGRLINPTTEFVFLFHNASSGAWEDAACSTGSPTPSFDAANVVVSGTVCHGPQVALFVVGSFATVEGSLVSSVGSLLKSSNSSALSEQDRLDSNTRAVLTAASISKTLAYGLTPEDGPVSLVENGLKVTAQKAANGTFAGATTSTTNSDGVVAFAAVLPDSFQAAGGGSGATLSTVVIEGNPFVPGGNGSLSTESGSTPVYEFSLADSNGNVAVQDLVDPINISLLAPPIFSVNRSHVVRVCKFWDAAKGVWSTDGVETIDSKDDDSVICRTRHLSSYSVDFTISAPDVSLSNFDPNKSRLIFITYGVLAGFIVLASLYSYIERRLYDKRQLAIERGEIVDDEVVVASSEVEAAPTTGCKRFCFVRCCFNCCHRMKTQHSWVALMWPTGRRVYPKRFMKVLALMATFSIACGLDAVFAYTATVNTADGEAKTVNTATIAGYTIPMDGFWAFLISLPVLLTLSLCLGIYSAYMDVLRKVAPRRFRALTPRIRREMERRGIPVDALESDARKQLKRQAKNALKQKKQADTDTNSLFLENGVLDDPASVSRPPHGNDARAQAWVAPPMSSDDDDDDAVIGGEAPGGYLRIEERRDSLVDEMDFDHLRPVPADDKGVARTDSLLRPQDKGLQRSDSLLGRPQPGADTIELQPLAVHRTDSLLRPPAKSKGTAFARSDSLLNHSVLPELDEAAQAKFEKDTRLLTHDEFSADTEKLVERMRFWRRTSATVGFIVFFSGMVMTFLWVGSLDEEQQKRWLESFVTFEAISIFVSAPLFIILASAWQAWKERKKLMQQLDESMSDTKKHLKKASSQDARGDMSDELRDTLIKEISRNAMSFQFF